MTRPRALISTIEPVDGGVPTMTRCIADLLRELEIEPVFAWYEPWSSQPRLSVPMYALPSGRRPGSVARPAYGDHEGHGIGAWLPELEFTHYLPRRPWRELIASCSYHLSVTGNPLCAAPFARLGVPFLAWVATPWEADRTNRVRSFSRPRRWLDQGINSPVLQKLERQILQAPGSHVLALSTYTSRALERIAGRPMDGVLLMPVDTRVFHPEPGKVRPWRLGFSGRYGDPRKHIDLLLEAVSLLKRQGQPVELELVGEKQTNLLDAQLADLQIADRVHCHSHLPASDLAGLLQGMDVFVIPSHQEGLCIAALEAMACAVPVVSTRCGGPEEFVLDDHTGQLTASDPAAMAAAISSICQDRDRRERLAQGACRWINEHASTTSARDTFLRHFDAVYPSGPV